MARLKESLESKPCLLSSRSVFFRSYLGEFRAAGFALTILISLDTFFKKRNFKNEKRV